MTPTAASGLEPLKIYINGEWVDSEAQEFENVTDSATGEVIARTPLGGRGDVDRAVAAAKAAFPAWRDTPVQKRCDVMFNLRQLLVEKQEEIAAGLSREHGKTYPDAMGEVRRGIDQVEWACGMLDHMKGEAIMDVSASIDCKSVRFPLGVVAGITPFNFPIMVPMWMFPIAITAGNTFVLKPSEKDPLTMILVTELIEKAGMPKGVFNLVTGAKDCVNGILEHPDIKAVSFVGSTPVARHVYSHGSTHGKRVQALAGAKNHGVIMPDCDLDKTVHALTAAAYGSAGERCMAISAVVAVGDVADPLVEALAKEAENLRVGPGCKKESEMGPLITAEHRNRVASYLDKGVEEGAKLVVDGRKRQPVGEGTENGHFLCPSLFDHVKPNMSIYKEEIFGPVLVVLRVKDLDEALELVNNHEFGNGTAIFTNSGGAARRYMNECTVGMVGINVPIPVPMANFSFSGWKNSFFGDLHGHGQDGLRFWTENKVVTERWFSTDPNETGIRKWSV
ncbi:CoA-acylating methylmalonate-semialdehyde dehydrogenase [bacterium]|nr:CoA-acylating methylmalonate-semialdehyde dehydrogenase [bacterium]